MFGYGFFSGQNSCISFSYWQFQETVFAPGIFFHRVKIDVIHPVDRYKSDLIFAEWAMCFHIRYVMVAYCHRSDSVNLIECLIQHLEDRARHQWFYLLWIVGFLIHRCRQVLVHRKMLDRQFHTGFLHC